MPNRSQSELLNWGAALLIQCDIPTPGVLLRLFTDHLQCVLRTCGAPLHASGEVDVERLFTLKRAATILAVSPELVKKLDRQNRLRVVRLGRAVRVSEQELERLCREEFRD
jgi:excisionase family DNA binding protein